MPHNELGARWARRPQSWSPPCPLPLACLLYLSPAQHATEGRARLREPGLPVPAWKLLRSLEPVCPSRNAQGKMFPDVQDEQDNGTLSDGSAAGSGQETASSWERGREERLGEGYGALSDARAVLAGFKAKGSSGPRGLADGDLRGSCVPVCWVVSPGQGCSPVSRGLGRRAGQLLGAGAQGAYRPVPQLAAPPTLPGE